MDCAYCNRSTEGCASIKCSLCSSQFHLECVSSEQLVPSGNSWRCCKCEARAAAAQAPPLIDTVRA